MTGAAVIPEEAWETSGCGGSSRFWRIPVLLLGFILAAGVTVFALAWVHRLPVPPWAVGPYPPFWAFFPLGVLLVWLIVIFLVRPWGWRGRAGWATGRGWAGAPDETIRWRYARGEISREQMDEMLRHLEESTRGRDAPELRSS